MSAPLPVFSSPDADGRAAEMGAALAAVADLRRRAARLREAYCIALNTLNCVIHEEDNSPPDLANALRIARDGHAEALAVASPDILAGGR